MPPASQRPFSLWSPRTVSLFGQEPKREMGLDLRRQNPLSDKNMKITLGEKNGYF
jgi:hypothetical protein